ncbi:MAG: hypothetical protein MUE78_01215 [Ilumatobacteraceae bacterium]|jgi:hypothetical protein|nr:hypothetical protein [Ilumatobacteraceae bacterium]
MSLDTVWRDVVATALLGTDRREPAVLPPGRLADLVADAVDPTASRRLLTTVAALAAVRRSATAPGPPVAPRPVEPHDPRPLVPVAAVDDWWRLRREWQVLEPEWLQLVERHGWRLPPDVVADLDLRPPADRGVLPVPASLVPLLDADGTGLVAGLLDDLAAGRLGPAHRPVLVNLLARCRTDALAELVAAIERWEARPGLAHALADLGSLRLRMIEHLTP